MARPSGVSSGPTKRRGWSLKLFQPGAVMSGAGAAVGCGTPGAASVFRPPLAAASQSSVATETSELSVGGVQVPLVSPQASRSCSLVLSSAVSLAVPSAAYKSSAEPAQRLGQPSFAVLAAPLASAIRRN